MGRKSKSTVRKQEILSYFYDVIIDEGFEGASIAKIAKRMEVNPSLLIHYFSNKDAMVLGLIDYIISTYSSHILPDFSLVLDPQERWEDVLDVVSLIQWDRIMNNTVFYSCYTLGLRLPEVKERFVEYYSSFRKALVKEIVYANEHGVIQINDPEKAAKLMISLIEGSNFYQHLDSGKPNNAERIAMIKQTINHMFIGNKI
ncbi:MAG: TetR/AcrR family transcriptional regulator [Bacteroidia bacterium]|nr:TetR/AcrR family transcriptional regulator [Bacteroidia bacterium]